MGTLKQSRWGLLSAAYDAEDLCAALPAWMAGVDKEEGTRGVPSAQFCAQVQGVLEADSSMQSRPLVAPSEFAAHTGTGARWRDGEG